MILEQVLYEIHNTDYNKKLIAGVVLTGGGSMITDIVKLTEFTLGLDTRIGTPDEHLSGKVTDEMRHPMHATGIGLVLKGFQIEDEQRGDTPKKEEDNEPQPEEEISDVHDEEPDTETKPKSKGVVDKLNEFLRKIISDGRY